MLFFLFPSISFSQELFDSWIRGSLNARFSPYFTATRFLNGIKYSANTWKNLLFSLIEVGFTFYNTFLIKHLNGSHYLSVGVFFRSHVHFTPGPATIKTDGRFFQPITWRGRGVCLQGTDWPHQLSFAASNLNIPWHVVPVPAEYNSTWLAVSAGRHDFSLSSRVHQRGPGASLRRWSSVSSCCT